MIIRKMNRRGESSEKIPTWIIMLIALVIVVGFLFFFGGKLFSWLNIIPSNFEGQGKTGEAIIGYNIVDDKLRYYDGNDWRDIKAGVEQPVGGKDIDSDETLKRIKEFYYDKSLRGSVPFDMDYPEREGQKPSVLFAFGGGLGDLLIRVSFKEVFAGSDDYFLKNDNSFFIQYEEGGQSKYKEVANLENNPLLNELRNQAIKWRDSVLEKPVTLNVKDRKSGEVKICKYILEKNGKSKEYLIARLDEPVVGSC